VWPPLLFPSLFPTLLAEVTLREGGCGQRGGNRERSMVFHDEVASYRSRSCLLEAKCLRMIADHGRVTVLLPRNLRNERLTIALRSTTVGKERTSMMHYIH